MSLQVCTIEIRSYPFQVLELETVIPAGAGEGGTTDHAALDSLAWADSGHTGDADTLAGFDDAGDAVALSPVEALVLLGAATAAEVAAAQDAADAAADAAAGKAAVGSTAGAALAASASAGTSIEAARADHAHPRPSPGDIGAEVAGAAAAAVGAIPSDGTAATASLRTLGTGAQQAAAGDDSRLSDARTPTAHASSHAANGSDPLALAGALLAGVVCVRTLAAGIWWPNAVNGSNTSSSASAALTLYASPFVQETANEWDQIAAEPAVLAAGGLFKLQIFADAGGTLGGLIWDSGDLSSAVTGFRSIAFLAGTWADTSYKNGNNLKIKPGQTVFLALLTNNTTATFRWIAAAAARPLRHSGTIGANQVFTRFVATYPSYVTQNPVLSTLTPGSGVILRSS